MIATFLFMLFGCGETAEAGACESLCDQLVQTCEFGAYPTYESCEQGCLFDESKGADVSGLDQCITKAGCDEFGIVECTHRFGVTAASDQ